MTKAFEKIRAGLEEAKGMVHSGASASIPTEQADGPVVEGRHPALSAFIGLYFGPARITWNCIHPVKGRWNFRFIWHPGCWASWDISWPTLSKLRYARKLAARARKAIPMTDNTSMLERMARAIDPLAFRVSPSGVERVFRRARAYKSARAALQAIREPSEAMIEAGHYAIPSEPDSPADEPEAARDCFTAMIDAILSESPTNG